MIKNIVIKEAKTQEELHADCNYDSKSIIKIVHKVMQKNLVSQVG